MLLPVPIWYHYFMFSYDVTGVDYFALISTIGYFLLKVSCLLLYSILDIEIYFIAWKFHGILILRFEKNYEFRGFLNSTVKT